MDLGDRHGLARGAVGRIREGGAGQAHDRRNEAGLIAGHPIRHETAVRVADEGDPLGVDG